MSDFDPSPTLILIWETASQEAQSAGLPEISADHFFLQLCRFTSSPASLFTVEPGSHLHDALPSIRSELEELASALEMRGLDRVARQALAVELTDALGVGTTPYKAMRSRSAELKEFCEQAARQARREGQDKTRPADLLPFLLTSSSGDRHRLLQERGITVGADSEAR